LLWNANNTMGFHRIDWDRLRYVATLTTISRYMKQIMRIYGQDPLIIPNGISSDLLHPVPKQTIQQVREALCSQGEFILMKVGRFDPAKCWWMAIDAAAQLKLSGRKVIFLCRGGIEPHGIDVLNHARDKGLIVKDICGAPVTWEEVIELIWQAGQADLYNLCFTMSQSLLRVFYTAADVVLANSKHEPFGLVGLEAMAAGGVVFTGPTGETYSNDREGAIALDTETADEIVLQVSGLINHAERVRTIRHTAPKIAARFAWENILEVLFEKVQLAACLQNVQSFAHRPVKMEKDLVIYTVVHQPRRLRLPALPIPRNASVEEVENCLFDDELNKYYFRKVAERCYYPATRKLIDLIENGPLKLTIGFSMTFIEQARAWDLHLLNLYQRLVAHPNVELAVVEPYHSFILVWDLPRFIQRMKQARQQLEQVFGKTPIVADTTEMMMSDTIYHALNQVGMKGAFIDGRPWILEWRQPTYLYKHNQGAMSLLARHYQLSDDVGYRFSNRSWESWPLMATSYVDWLVAAQGDLVLLGWDYETFGEHHRVDTGIFSFLEAFVHRVPTQGLQFCTASEAIQRHEQDACDLPLPVYHSTWAGSGGLEFFLGNSAQQAIFQLMMSAYNKALLTHNSEYIDLALRLAQSDNLHMIQWFGRSGSEAEVSAYFTPQEWWQLGPDQIVWEIQQVYRNFIEAMDGPLSLAKPSR
jgi:alpha-amylase